MLLPMHELGIKNRLDDLETVSNWVNELADQFQLTPKCTFRLDLVLSEAVTNIIQNAYPDGAEHDIWVSLQLQGSSVRAEVQDDGVPFDPTQIPEVVLPQSLEEATEGGLGIHLIRSYTQECVYQRQDDRNVLTLVLLNAE